MNRDDELHELEGLDLFSPIDYSLSITGSDEAILAACSDLENKSFHRAMNYPKLIRAVLHECTHYWQFLSTTYGFHYSRATLAQSRIVKEILKLLDSVGTERFHLPLAQLKLQQIPVSVREDVEELRLSWKCLEEYKRVLHHQRRTDTDPRSFFAKVWTRAVEYIGKVDAITAPFCPRWTEGLEQFNLTLTPVEGLGLAPIDPKYNTQISGATILEAAAMLQEAELVAYLMMSSGNFMPEEYMANAYSSPAYFIAFDAAYPILSRCLDKSNLSKIEKPVAIVNITKQLLDLALMGCFDPLYADPPRHEISWIDIHPGMRFHLALAAIREQGLPRNTLDIEAICERWGWTPPSMVARAGIQYKVHSELEDLIGQGMTMINVKPFGMLWHTHFQAAEHRYEHPNSFVDTFANFGHLMARFPPPFIRTQAEPLINSRWMGFYFYHKAMRHIFLSRIEELAIEKLVEVPEPSEKPLQVLVEFMGSVLWNQIGYERRRFC